MSQALRDKWRADVIRARRLDGGGAGLDSTAYLDQHTLRPVAEQ